MTFLSKDLKFWIALPFTFVVLYFTSNTLSLIEIDFFKTSFIEFVWLIAISKEKYFKICYNGFWLQDNRAILMIDTCRSLSCLICLIFRRPSNAGRLWFFGYSGWVELGGGEINFLSTKSWDHCCYTIMSIAQSYFEFLKVPQAFLE